MVYPPYASDSATVSWNLVRLASCRPLVAGRQRSAGPGRQWEPGAAAVWEAGAEAASGGRVASLAGRGTVCIVLILHRVLDIGSVW